MDEGDNAADYLASGGQLDSLFPPSFPTDLAAQGIWVTIKRDAMAAAMRRAADSSDRSYFVTHRVPIAGTPFHQHDRPEHRDDSFTRGVERLGPLAYSLLRGYEVVKEHQVEQLESLHDSYEDLVAGVIGARAEGLPDPTWQYKARARMVFWQGLGLLLQVSEELAVIFDAVQRWEGTGQDLGQLIVTSRVRPWRAFRSPVFGSLPWWRRQLNLRPSVRSLRRLTTAQRDLLLRVSGESEVFVRDAVTGLRRTWTEDLHRAATRYKHSYPLLDSSHGVAWSGAGADATRIRALVAEGALVVADADRGGLVQIVVPVTIGGIELLFGAINLAMGLTRALSYSLLQRAEHGNQAVITVPPFGTADPAPLGEISSLFGAYFEMPDFADGVDYGIRKAQARASVDDAARRIRGGQASHAAGRQERDDAIGGA